MDSSMGKGLSIFQMGTSIVVGSLMDCQRDSESMYGETRPIIAETLSRAIEMGMECG